MSTRFYHRNCFIWTLCKNPFRSWYSVCKNTNVFIAKQKVAFTVYMCAWYVVRTIQSVPHSEKAPTRTRMFGCLVHFNRVLWALVKLWGLLRAICGAIGRESACGMSAKGLKTFRRHPWQELTITCQPERRVTLLVFHIHSSHVLQKELHKAVVALVSCDGQGCVSGRRYRGCVDVCPLVDEDRSYVCVAARRCLHERCQAGLGGFRNNLVLSFKTWNKCKDITLGLWLGSLVWYLIGIVH